MFRQIRAEIAIVRRGQRVIDRARVLATLGHAHLWEGRLRTLTDRFGPPSPRVMRVRLKDGLDLSVRLSDGVVLTELALDPYGIDFGRLGEVRSVLDVGANIGLATICLARHLPAAEFVCVEPCPQSFELLRRNLVRNVERAWAINAPIVGQSGERVRLLESAFPGLSRTEADPAGVSGLTMSELLDRAGFERVDLVKIDIEGAEREVFAGVAEWGDRVRAIIAELHPPLSPSAALDLLAPAGFEQVSLTPGKRHDGIFYAVRG